METHAVYLVMEGPTPLGQSSISQNAFSAICLLSLVFKRFVDSELRPWRVWLFDVLKQAIQVAMNHLIIVGLSKAFQERLDVGADLPNWYWVNMLVDSTIGVLLSLLLLRSIQCGYRMKCVGRPDLARCGDYGDPPNIRVFFRQLGDWLALSALRRMILAFVVASFRQELSVSADWLLGWLEPYTRAKFLIVAVFSPLAFGVFALWVTDSFLRADRSSSGLGSDQARERLMSGLDPGSQTSTVAASASQLEEDEEEGDRLVTFEEWKRRGISAMFGRQGPVPLAGTELVSRSSAES